MPAQPPPRRSIKQAAMVRWNQLRMLGQTILSAGAAEVFSRFADKRETQASLSPDEFSYEEPEHLGADGSFWLDFASDTGDGFDSTYTVAWLLAQARLPLTGTGAGEYTERGRVLVLGGDQVYPAASWDRYRERFVDPYTAALPFVRDRPPDLFAIPGNHDWYDGLTSFMRLLCQEHWVGGWHTQQKRSYFAIKLPGRWWLWGIDVQLDTYIDEPQLDYFEEIATKQLAEGDRVILVTAKPSWIKAQEDPDAQSWKTLTFFEETMIRRHGGVPELVLTGDLHHYCRYEAQGAGAPRHRITCGGAGAYLYGTHSMPDWLRITAHGAGTQTAYRRAAVYPEDHESRRLARQLRRLYNPFRRHALGHAPAIVYTIFALLIAAAVKDQSGNLLASVRDRNVLELASDSLSPWVLGFALLVLVLLDKLAEIRPPARRRWYALAHWLAHLGPVYALTLLALWALAELDLADSGFWPGYLTAALIGALGYWWGRVVLVKYYLRANRSHPGRHMNDLFASQSIEDYKCFLRMRIDPRDGKLTMFPIGVRSAVKDWRAKQPAVGDELLEPWFEPASGVPPQAELIEDPITIE
jgi:hypothetical protein